MVQAVDTLARREGEEYLVFVRRAAAFLIAGPVKRADLEDSEPRADGVKSKSVERSPTDESETQALMKTQATVDPVNVAGENGLARRPLLLLYEENPWAMVLEPRFRRSCSIRMG